MSAAEALKAARIAGVRVALVGEDLVLEAQSQPSPTLLDALSHYKDEIVALLRPGRDRWSAEDWQVFFDERAGIAEFDGGLSRKEAEARAFACCVVEWVIQHPRPSAPGRCAWCGMAESHGAVVLPFGIEPGTHTWLHAECWPDWYEARRADAMAALHAIAIGFFPTAVPLQTCGATSGRDMTKPIRAPDMGNLDQ